jgi:hypothetical protein
MEWVNFNTFIAGKIIHETIDHSNSSRKPISVKREGIIITTFYQRGGINE